MYDDLLGPRKEKKDEETLRKKYKLDVPPSKPDAQPDGDNDPWAGAGEDLIDEEELDEELELALEALEEEIDEELELALEALEEDEDDICNDCDGCDDEEVPGDYNQLSPEQDIGC